jgi:hypothetical protein
MDKLIIIVLKSVLLIDAKAKGKLLILGSEQNDLLSKTQCNLATMKLAHKSAWLH